MKVSREKAAENRERILKVAARLFREKGFDGIGVADLMKSAGLTHGGFYGHFSSKEDLMAQACALALNQSLNKWRRIADRAPDNPLSAITRSYLSTQHRDEPGRGCTLTALGSDVSRQAAPVREKITEGVRSIVEFLSGLIPAKAKAAKREKALASFAAMVGAIVLSRAVDDAELSQEILEAVLISISKQTATKLDTANS